MSSDAHLIGASAPESQRTSYLPLFALALASAIGFTTLGSFNTIQEAAKSEMGLSDHSLSLVMGVATAVPMLLLSIPIGVLVDRTNRVRLLIGLGCVWTAGTLLTALSSGVVMLFAARMMVGIGATGALTACLSLAADLCPPDRRGKAMLIVTLGKSLGQAAGFALVGWLFGLFLAGAIPAWTGDIAPWRSSHLSLAAISVALLLPLLLLREPVRREVAAGPRAPFKALAAELWQRRAFLLPLFAGQIGVVMADAAASIWAAGVLSRNFGLSPEQFAGWMGVVIFGTGIGGAILGGIAADAGHKSGRRGGILIGAVIAAALGIPAALFPVAPSVTLFAIGLGVLMLSGTITGLIMSVALTVYLPNEVRGLCIGAFISVAGLIGFGVAPTLVATVSSFLGGEQMLGTALALVGTIVSVLGLLCFSIASKRAPELP